MGGGTPSSGFLLKAKPIRGADRGPPLRSGAPVTTARPVARTARPGAGTWALARWHRRGYSLTASRSSSSPSFPSVWRSSTSQTSRTPSGPPGVGRQQPSGASRHISSIHKAPAAIVMGKAEQKNGLRSKPGRAIGDRHRLEDASPRRVQKDAPAAAHLRTDAPARREVRVRDFRLLEPAADILVLAGVHRAPDEVGVGEDLIALGDVDLDAARTAHPVAVSRRGSGGVSGIEDAAVHLETGQVG